MKREIIIIKKSEFNLRRLKDKDILFYYLSEDYQRFINLKNKFVNEITLGNAAGMLNDVFQKNRESVLKAFSELNSRYNSFVWWGSQIASKSTTATPLTLNVTYYFCAIKIMSESSSDIVFIVDSKALAKCIENFAKRSGCRVRIYYDILSEIIRKIRQPLYYFAQTLYYLFTELKLIFLLRMHKKPLLKQSAAKKQVVIKSWVTDNAFGRNGRYEDRNFGMLLDWLAGKGYQLWILPAFFNIKIGKRNLLSILEKQEYAFLIPENYLTFFDYIVALWHRYRILNVKIDSFMISGENLSVLVNEVKENRGLEISLGLFNLCSPMLKRLRQKGFKADTFYYSFECNAPEKQFLLSAREYFPDAAVVGYQHTTFFLNQLAYQLSSGEQGFHPLPDKIICSGKKYYDLHKQYGFPESILEKGPNLRFKSVYLENNGKLKANINSDKRGLFIPLTFSHDLAYEIFKKVQEAIYSSSDYRIYIRTHPLLSKTKLLSFLDKIELKNFEFADEGLIQDWLPNMFAMITIGGSITTLEAICMGIPTIRVIPDNLLHYDAFHSESYPLSPVNTPEGIRRNLGIIDRVLRENENIFKDIGKQALAQYFTKPDEQSLRVFELV